MSEQVVVIKISDAEGVRATCEALGLSEESFKELQSRSTAAKATAYCNYSRFRVGSTILTQQGTFISGANVENACYPVGVCAERVAFSRAVTDGHRDFKAVAVATDVEGTPATPCGMCRQFIREFCDGQLPIIMFNKHGDFIARRLGELLPLSFGPEALPPPSALP